MKRESTPLIREKSPKEKESRTLKESLRAHSLGKAVSPVRKAFEGNEEIMIDTGSTLLNLIISGNRKYGGGIPPGIMVEAFGESGTGKTIFLCELAGAVQRLNGDIMFNDPEARLNHQFAQMFDFDTTRITINQPDTVTEMIGEIEAFEPKNEAKVHGIFTDSLAALSTDLEMTNKDGDKMGMRRAKEFSEGLRKVCRIIKDKNYLLVCSNQVRQKTDAANFGEQFITPGGKAVAFYASLRLRFYYPEKIKKKIKIKGKVREKIIGSKVVVEVYKNSVAEPYKKADLYIIFDYGIDNIRGNLQYLKDINQTKTYMIGENDLGIGMDNAIAKVEKNGLEKVLEEKVIQTWMELEEKFRVVRKKKKR